MPAQTALVLDPFFKLHDTGAGHPECAERLTVIEHALAPLLPNVLQLEPRDAVNSELALVHAQRYLDMVQQDLRFGAGHLSTGDTVISDHSGEVARRATGGVLNAVDAVMQGRAQSAFCAVRPPGHHATPVTGMGFCIYNHIAIAARYAQKKHGVGKILIVDWDVHHGNGTQDAFYADDSVLFFSSHQYPWYPGTGAADETGTGRGLGYNVNAPLRAGSGFAEIQAALLTKLWPKLREFRPELILISAGFDSRVEDPLGEFTLEDEDFAKLTRLLMEWAHGFASGRLISILEGGYNLGALGNTVASHVQTLMAGSVADASQ
ncbi:MAG TPA: histone deacetylase [Phycisphaerae bacterium]|nr:histone deacetylase [Phycisphaerae bacterium]